jgi:hypothetical protein
MIDSGLYAGGIEYHNYDDYTNEYSLGRIEYYGIVAYPRTIIDGVLIYDGGGYLTNNYEHYLPLYNQRIGIRSAFQMDIYGTEDVPGTYILEVVIHKKAPVINDHLVAHISLTESQIPEPGWLLGELDFVCRKFVPDIQGIPIEVINDSTWILTYPLSFEETWAIENCEITAFIQDTLSSEIFQADKIMVNHLLPFTLTGGFSVNDSSIFEGTTIEFADTSAGSPAYWQWIFPGGEPGISHDKNPLVLYDAPGLYDVTMIVSDGVHSDTVIKPDYITVVDFVGIPEENNEQIEILPNPSNGRFTVSINVSPGTVVLITLYNAMGNIVFDDTKVNDGTRYYRKFDFNNLKEGIYFLSIRNQGIHYCSKVMIWR